MFEQMKYWPIFFCLFLHAEGFCREFSDEKTKQRESLQQQLAKHSINDTIRANLLILLAWNLKTEQSDSALKCAQEALEIARTYNMSGLIASAEDNIGVIYQIKTDYKQALFHHLQALEIARIFNLPGLIASAEDNIGVIYQIKADYRQALFHHLQAMRINEHQSNIARRAKTLNNIGQVYFMLKKYDQSLLYYNQAIAYVLRDTSSSINETLIAYYNNIAGSYVELKKTERAILYYERSNQKSVAVTGHPNGIGCVNLAEIYINQNNVKKAKYYCNEAFRISKNNAYLQFICYFCFGRIAALDGKYDEALQNFFLSKKISEKSGIFWQRAEIGLEIALVYQKKNDFKRAFQYYKEFHETSSKTLNETLTKQISEMQAKYDASKKDEQIERLSHEKERIKAESDKSRLMGYFMIFSVIGISGIGIVVARNMILKQRFHNKALSEKNAITQLQKEQIERANMVLVAEKITAQYEVLKSKIDPHFLFNSLSTLSALIVKGRESALFFVENFSELYRRILNTSEQQLISLEEELEIVKRYLFLQQIEFGKNLCVKTEISPSFRQKKIPPFALQMVVENAIKHNVISSRQNLHINISTSEKRIVVENTLQLKRYKIQSTGIAVKNIFERYKMVSDMLPTFEEHETIYCVTLPLLDN